jgi:hypothetical protein
MDGLTIGRIVHYQAMPTEGHPGCLAAIVTDIHDSEIGLIELTVFASVAFQQVGRVQYIAYGDKHQPGTWHWPEGLPSPAVAASDQAQEPETKTVPI